MDAKAVHERLVTRFGDRVTGANLEVASPFAVVAAGAIVEVAGFCKGDPALAFDNLMCLSAVDYPKESRPPRWRNGPWPGRRSGWGRSTSLLPTGTWWSERGLRDRQRRRRLESRGHRDRRDGPEHGAAAPLHPRGAAHRAQDRRRGGEG